MQFLTYFHRIFKHFAKDMQATDLAFAVSNRYIETM